MNIMWKKVHKETRSRKKRQAPLNPACQAKIKSSIVITSFVTCVEELILNSLDSKSSCISIRVDTTTSFIQIVDNGKGIPRKSLEQVGERHSTSKPLPSFFTGEHVKPGLYGHRGEALASVIELSNYVQIISRSSSKDQETFKKEFRCGEASGIKQIENRPCMGTTICIRNLFYKAPVRRKCSTPDQDMSAVLQMVQNFAIVLAGKVSISLKDDHRGRVYINTTKISAVKDAIWEVFGSSYCSNLQNVRGRHEKIVVNGVISTVCYVGRKVKLITLNEKIIISHRIQQAIESLLKTSLIALASSSGDDNRENDTCKVLSKPRHYLYVIDIKCPDSYYYYNVTSDRTSVEFECWQSALNSIYKIIKTFLIDHNLHKSVDVKRDASVEDLDKSCVDQPEGRKSPRSLCSPVTRDKMSHVSNRSKEMKILTDIGQSTLEGVDDSNPDEIKITETAEDQDYVVYWLLKHVPQKTPQLEEHLVPHQHSQHISMLANHSNTNHSPNLTMMSLEHHSDLSNKEGSPLSKRRRFLSSSLNEDHGNSLFGSKLKVKEVVSSNNHVTKPYCYQVLKSADASFGHLIPLAGNDMCVYRTPAHSEQFLMARNNYSDMESESPGRYFKLRNRSDSKLEEDRLKRHLLGTPKIDSSLTKKCLSAKPSRTLFTNVIMKSKLPFKLHSSTTCRDEELWGNDLKSHGNFTSNYGRRENQKTNMSLERILSHEHETSDYLFSPKLQKYNTKKDSPSLFCRVDVKSADNHTSTDCFGCDKCTFAKDRPNVFKEVNTAPLNPNEPASTASNSSRNTTDFLYGLDKEEPTEDLRSFFRDKESGLMLRKSDRSRFDRVTSYETGGSNQRDTFSLKKNSQGGNESISLRKEPGNTSYTSTDCSCITHLFNMSSNCDNKVAKCSSKFSWTMLSQSFSVNSSGSRCESSINHPISYEQSSFSPTKSVLRSSCSSYSCPDYTYSATLMSLQSSNYWSEIPSSAFEHTFYMNASVKSEPLSPTEVHHTPIKVHHTPIPQQQVNESMEKPLLAQDCNSMSSFTSEEIRQIDFQVNLQRSRNSFVNQKCYIDLLTGCTVPSIYFEAKERLDNLPEHESVKLSLYSPTIHCQTSMARVRNIYTTPKLLPNIKNMTPKTGDFVLFDKELLTPLQTKNEIIFSPSLLEKPNILGQWGKQFILISTKTSSGNEILIALDQHAAHERVRLERLEHQCLDQIDGFPLVHKLKKPDSHFINDEIMQHILDPEFQQRLKTLGLEIELEGKTVKVLTVPKVARLVTLSTKEIFDDIVYELIERPNLRRPKAVTEVLNSQACRGAIKFGDELTLSMCHFLIKKLSTCKLPFQCAHGRPSCQPLYDLTALDNAKNKGWQKQRKRLNFTRIKCQNLQ